MSQSAEINENTPIVLLQNSSLVQSNAQIYLKRDDLIHPHISGNKWRKLKYNVKFVKHSKYSSMLTFGGAYSNHIAATAVAGKIYQVSTIGIIRGNDKSITEELNPTLQLAQQNGMQLMFVSRSAYKNKEQLIQELSITHPNAFVIPEGGANQFAVLGTKEINTDYNFSTIVCACGTGTTLVGIVSSLQGNQKAIGISALKNGAFLKDEVNKLIPTITNFKIETDYSFGGYAKITPELVEFMQQFYKIYKIKLDPIYTAKMAYAIFDKANKGHFSKNEKILMVHSGGLQGIAGMEKRYNVSFY